jgi:hypothetical protein
METAVMRSQLSAFLRANRTLSGDVAVCEGSISAGQAQIASHRPEVTLWPGAVVQSLQRVLQRPALARCNEQPSERPAFGLRAASARAQWPHPELHHKVAFSKPVRNSFHSGRDTALDGDYKDLVMGLERRCSAGFR